MARSSVDDCFDELQALRRKWGTSIFDAADLKLRRMRIEPGRVKRKRFSNATYSRLYKRQGGLCAECSDPMLFIKGKMDIDHKDPNLQGDDFNRETNLRLTHPKCNREKGAKSIYEQALSHGETVAETLQR